MTLSLDKPRVYFGVRVPIDKLTYVERKPPVRTSNTFTNPEPVIDAREVLERIDIVRRESLQRIDDNVDILKSYLKTQARVLPLTMSACTRSSGETTSLRTSMTSSHRARRGNCSRPLRSINDAGEIAFLALPCDRHHAEEKVCKEWRTSIVFVPVTLLSGSAKFIFTPLALNVVLALVASYALSPGESAVRQSAS